MSNSKRAKAIVEAILCDMTDRRGLRQEWDQIDADIQKEIRAEWRRIVIAILDPAGGKEAE